MGRQAELKWTSDLFSVETREGGLYGKKREALRSFCLPWELRRENLFPPIRDEAYAFFGGHNIAWHAEGENHLLSSQAFAGNTALSNRTPGSWATITKASLKLRNPRCRCGRSCAPGEPGRSPPKRPPQFRALLGAQAARSSTPSKHLWDTPCCGSPTNSLEEAHSWGGSHLIRRASMLAVWRLANSSVKNHC